MRRLGITMDEQIAVLAVADKGSFRSRRGIAGGWKVCG